MMMMILMVMMVERAAMFKCIEEGMIGYTFG